YTWNSSKNAWLYWDAGPPWMLSRRGTFSTPSGRITQTSISSDPSPTVKCSGTRIPRSSVFSSVRRESPPLSTEYISPGLSAVTTVATTRPAAVSAPDTTTGPSTRVSIDPSGDTRISATRPSDSKPTSASSPSHLMKGAPPARETALRSSPLVRPVSDPSSSRRWSDATVGYTVPGLPSAWRRPSGPYERSDHHPRSRARVVSPVATS